MLRTRLFTLLSLLTALLLVISAGFQSLAAQPAQARISEPSLASVATTLRSSPVMLIENVGQYANGARFQVRGADRTMWLADDAIWITVFEAGSSDR